MSGLNPPQQKAVDTLRGPLLVLAGAGTGKTRVVTMRIAKLIKSGIKPDRILAVTFTNKAAMEMKERVASQIGKRLKKKPIVSTFHSLCVKILRQHIDKLGYPKTFVIYNRGDQESVARGVLREIRVNDKTLKPSDVLNKIGSWKSRSIRPEQAVRVAETDKDHLAATVYRRYQRQIKNLGAVDFDDLLLLTEELFEKSKEALQEEARKYDHLLIDEYQDTNQSQYRIAKALVAGHRNLCVVGDDDQSIYSWRGAEVEHILRFQYDWPDATMVCLESNYRSTQAILDWGNRLIDFNTKRHEKVLQAARPGGDAPAIYQYKDENLEAEQTVSLIRQRLSEPGFEPQDIAILFRTNEQPRVFEAELRKAKIPYVLVGTSSFFDRREVKDLVSYLRVIAAPHDEVALQRIINTPKRSLGPGVVEKLLDAATKTGTTMWDLVVGKVPRPPLRPAATKALDQFRDDMVELQDLSKSCSQMQLVERLIQKIKYRSFLESQYDEPEEQEMHWNNVASVVNTAAEFDTANPDGQLIDFLAELTVGDREFDNEKEKQLSRNAIILMTMHSAKGLEFPEVYMVGMEEGILPHTRSIGDEESVAEERRLCYVGITRAKERLILSFPLTRKKWGKVKDTVPSRFLYEMTGQAENPKHLAKR